MSLIGLVNFKNPELLAVKICLGLHIMYLWTPMELGTALNKILRVIIGKKPANIVSLGLIIILKVLPGMVLAASKLKETLRSRTRNLSLFRRLTLIARSLIRLESQRSEELVRAIMSR
jgi:hypothetical protein